MHDLVILSERNIYDWLVSKGVYPSKFFTDFERFKARVNYLKGARVVIIFSGSCRFSKSRVSEFANRLMESSEMRGIVSVDVLSDTLLPLCTKYYKYEDIPVSFEEYGGTRKKTKLLNDDVWSRLEHSPCTSPELYLCSDDLGDSSGIREYFRSKASEDDERLLISRINIPEFINT